MSIEEFCTKDVAYVSPDTPITDIAKEMAEENCGCIFIGKDDKLIGVVTDRDIVLRCVAKSENPDTMQADQCMSPKVLYCYEDSEAEDVLVNMAEVGVRRMPVVDQDKNLKGVVSFGDLAAACDDKEVAGEAMEKIRLAA